MQRNIFVWTLVLMLITLACGAVVPPTVTAVPSLAAVQPTVTATPLILTSTPPPTQISPTATVITATPQPTAPTGLPVSSGGISFVIPDGLATNATAIQIAAANDQNAPPWELAPAHTNLTLDGYLLADKFFVPTIYVYPAQEYAAVQPGAADSIARLQAILASPNAPLSMDALPYLPFANAAQIFYAQPKVLSFQNGSGIRFLTEYAQYYATVNNRDLFYHFQGLTSDGAYYVLAILPVSAPILAADERPESPVPAGGIPFPGYAASEADMQAYYNNITRLLDGTSPDSFSPSLLTLDNLIGSMQIKAP